MIAVRRTKRGIRLKVANDPAGLTSLTKSARRSVTAEPRGVLLVVVAAVVARLDRLPPVAVLAVPVDRRLEAAAVERVLRRPAERAQLRRVDGVAAVVAGAVRRRAAPGRGSRRSGRGCGERPPCSRAPGRRRCRPRPPHRRAARSRSRRSGRRPAAIRAAGARRRTPAAGRPSSAFVMKSGRNFSGYCRAPYVLAPRVTSASAP